MLCITSEGIPDQCFSDEHMNNEDTKHVSKVIIVYKGKLLLLLPMNKQKWHLPGGHIKRGETSQEGARREVKEETQLLITSFTSVYRLHNFELFLCKTSTNNVKLSSEHRSYKWVTSNEALHKMYITKETERDLTEAINKQLIVLPAQKQKITKKKQQQDVDLEDEENK